MNTFDDILKKYNKSWHEVTEVNKKEELGRFNVDDIVVFEDELHWIEEVHKNAEGVSVILETMRNHNLIEVVYTV